MRAPPLTITVSLEEGARGAIRMMAGDDSVRFNSLPFRTEGQPDAVELALVRLIEGAPGPPVDLR